MKETAFPLPANNCWFRACRLPRPRRQPSSSRVSLLHEQLRHNTIVIQKPMYTIELNRSDLETNVNRKSPISILCVYSRMSRNPLVPNCINHTKQNIFTSGRSVDRYIFCKKVVESSNESLCEVILIFLLLLRLRIVLKTTMDVYLWILRGNACDCPSLFWLGRSGIRRNKIRRDDRRKNKFSQMYSDKREVLLVLRPVI